MTLQTSEWWTGIGIGLGGPRLLFMLIRGVGFLLLHRALPWTPQGRAS